MKYRLIDILCCPYDGQFPLIPHIKKSSSNQGHGAWHVGARPHCDLYCRYHDKQIRVRNGSQYECKKCMQLEIEEAILSCPSCGRWFPVRDKIVSIMPDELRERNESLMLDGVEGASDSSILRDIASRGAMTSNNNDSEREDAAEDKKAEMKARDKNASLPFQPDYVKKHEIYSVLRKISPSKEGRLLDLGVGVGVTALRYIRAFGEAVVADYSHEPLKKLLERYEKEGITNYYPIQMDACFMPFRKGIFTNVVSLQMLQHAPGSEMRSRILNNIKKVTAEEGEVILTVYNDHLVNILARLLRYRNYTMKEGHHSNGIYYYSFSYREFRDLLKKEFKVEEIVGCAPFIPKVTKYLMRNERLGFITANIVEKGGMSPIFGDLLMARCRKRAV